MSDGTHTPGPWRVAGKKTIRSDNGWIATMHWQNSAANAALVAAAPDMLAALKNVRSLYRSLTSDTDAIAVAMLAEIDAAIARSGASDA